MMVPEPLSPALVLPFDTRPDLAATMDIQIPALAWQPIDEDHYRRAYHLGGRRVEVTVWADGHRLCFTVDDGGKDRSFETNGENGGKDRSAETGAETGHNVREQVLRILRATFPLQIADLDLGPHPILTALHQRYTGVVVMWADPFEALVLTILSQNRSGQTVRQIYPHLADTTGGATPAGLVTYGEARLREVIRSAGPYKAPRLFDTTALVVAGGGGGSSLAGSLICRPAKHWRRWSPCPGSPTRPPRGCWSSPGQLTPFVRVRAQVEGLHHWPDAPAPDTYLTQPHRHLFIVDLRIKSPKICTLDHF